MNRSIVGETEELVENLLCLTKTFQPDAQHFSPENGGIPPKHWYLLTTSPHGGRRNTESRLRYGWCQFVFIVSPPTHRHEPQFCLALVSCAGKTLRSTNPVIEAQCKIRKNKICEEINVEHT